ncbi:MAG TPA: protein kinase [Vicinamibacterales bacterium]|nr:protein kinase [Vicinamibacterales bacterium]
MQLTTGTRLGPYEIVAPLGAGGMGEVYKARDTRLQRTVAIKVLPPQVLAEPGLRARFEREARAISGLDHPNICVLHDVGREGDIEYIVMQYLDGETLADRLARGPLPLAEALRVAIDIAAALDKAHRAGILHRDIKPGNVMLVNSAGQASSAKLLDFGLAKPVGTSDAMTVLTAGGQATATSPLTGRGTILGTLLYMSPEQLEGGEVDARSDIFSFGAMLYEMVTGKRAFQGSSQASVIAAILERDPPPMTTIVPVTPLALDRVVRKCLAKDRERRWQSAADLCDELTWIAQSADMPAQQPSRSSSRSRLTFILGAAAVLLTIALGALIASWRLRNNAPSEPIARTLAITLPDGIRLTRGGLAVSPDGRWIAFVASEAPRTPEGSAVSRSGATSRLYIRRFDSNDVTVIPGTGGARTPFFSPDGQSVGYFTARALQKVSLRGGLPVRVAGMPPVTRGGVWLPDGSVVISPTQTNALVLVSGDGTSKPLTTLKAGENGHLWPQDLPGRQDILYTIRRGTTIDLDASDVGLVNVATGEQRVILKGGALAQYSPTGHLLFVRNGTLSAIRFDLAKKEVSGTPVPIATGLAVDPWIGGAHYAVAADGALLYLRGAFPQNHMSAFWVDRSGVETPAAGFTGRMPGQPRISPNGTLALFDTPSPDGDDEVYVADLARGTSVRLSNDPQDDFDPVWTPDGRQVIWTAFPSGRLPFLVMRSSDGSGRPQEIVQEGSAQFPGSVSPSRVLAYTRAVPTGASDIWTVPLDGDRKGRAFIDTAAVEFGPEFSPDGKWVAYVSNESGDEDIYVVPYPGPGAKHRITVKGGASPVWSRDGRELFFQTSEGLMAVPVTAGADIAFGAPRRLFGGDFMIDSREDGPRAYDVAPDGKRFLMFRSTFPDTAPPAFHVLLGWASSLDTNSRK